MPSADRPGVDPVSANLPLPLEGVNHDLATVAIQEGGKDGFEKVLSPSHFHGFSAF